jgi:nitroreductase
MSITELVIKNRSYRRYNQSIRIERNELVSLVNLARHSASGTNRQPLKYLLFNSVEDCARIFPFPRWAGYLKDWDGPVEGERPSAYIVILGDKSIAKNYFVDHGIAAQSILLGATEKGYGGCMIGSIDRKGLYNEINLPEQFEILLIVALGKPVEKVVIDDIIENKVEYWRDRLGTHHVPKRSLDELIIEL